MMKTRDCAKNYVSDMMNYGLASKYCKANSCEAIRNYFVSYSTPICEYVKGKFHLATKKYSVTTSKQQNYLRFFIPSELLVEVEEIKSDKFPFVR